MVEGNEKIENTRTKHIPEAVSNEGRPADDVYPASTVTVRIERSVRKKVVSRGNGLCAERGDDGR